jgi:metallothionein
MPIGAYEIQLSGRQEVTQYSTGTVLTCAHEGCDCRVLIQEECHCPSGDRSYTCACGAPLVEVSDTKASAG